MEFCGCTGSGLLTRVSDYCKPILLEFLKDVHEGMSDPFRVLLESKELTIYYNAPTVILVIGKTESRFRWIDCCLCAENLMLVAHALGIGSCWIGSMEPVYDNEELMAEFHIPDGYSPIGTIAFGYPAEKPMTPNKKSPLITWLGNFFLTQFITQKLEILFYSRILGH